MCWYNWCVGLIEGLDGFGLAVWTATAVLPAGFALWWGTRPLGRRVDHWAAARRVPHTPETRAWVTARLQRSRRWRSIGVAVGLLTPYVWTWVQRSVMEGQPDGTVLIVLGYVAGALASEISAARRTRATGVAALERRRADQYLPRSARYLARVLAAVGVAIALIHFHFISPIRAPGPGIARIVLGLLLVLGALAAVETVPRMVARRPQPFDNEPMRRADNAMRAWSACSVGGALLALMLVTVANLWFSLAAYSDVQLIRWSVWLAIPAAPVAIALFMQLSDYESPAIVTDSSPAAP